MWKCTNTKFLLLLTCFSVSVTHFFLCSGLDIEGLDHHGYCGTIYHASPELLSKSNGRHLEPWSAAIFTKSAKNRPYTFIGEGVLLSNSTVLTIANIFKVPGSAEIQLQRLDNYIVAFGVNSTDFPHRFDDLSIFASVHWIEISKDKQQQMLAIIHLKEEIIYSPFVNEICIPKKFVALNEGDKVSMGGFMHIQPNALTEEKTTEKTRLVSKLVVRNKTLCEEKYKRYYGEHVPSELYCATPIVDEIGDDVWPKSCHRGMAVTYFHEQLGQNFLLGTFVKYFEITRSTDISMCTAQSIYFFESLERRLNWILDNVRCGAWKAMCSTDPNHCVEGQLKCGKGSLAECISIDDICSKQRYCEGPNKIGNITSKQQINLSMSKFSSEINLINPPMYRSEAETSKKYCSLPVIPTNTKLNWIFPEHYSDKVQNKADSFEDLETLEASFPSGTKLRLECQEFYISSGDFSSFEMSCMENEQWYPSSKDLHCKLDCGKVDSPAEPLIANGWNTTVFSYPWHGMLFSRTQDGIDYTCGVTLISKSVVITAAHCVSKEQSRGNSNTFDPSILQVVFGSSVSDIEFSFTNETLSVQKFQVKDIKIPDNFNPRNFDGDIAAIHLERDVTLSDTVRPVCFPFPGERSKTLELHQLSPGVIGYVAGFGIDETRELPTSLRSIGIPYVSHGECAKALDRTILSSQFCGGYTNGSGTCHGDSGGAIIFSEGTGVPRRYFIQGVVSNAQPIEGTTRCNHNNFSVFTKVSSFASWVQQQINSFDSH